MELARQLRNYAIPERAKHSARFFKTGPGQYGAGDKFLGVRVPDIRKVARLGSDLPLSEVKHLLESVWHEERLLAAIILVMQYEQGNAETRQRIYDFYMHNIRYINNWDIVDSSARQIVGAQIYLLQKGTKPLRDLAVSSSMWQRRVAIIATQYWLKQHEAGPTLELAELLLHDPEDLMHKAVGWMLREVGKYVDPDLLRSFLAEHATTMPRTTLRYAIEHFSPEERHGWLGRA